MKRRNLAPVLALITLVAPAVRTPAAAGHTVRVFAAASLTEAFREIGAVYTRAHPGDRVEFNFAGSQVLRTQIEQGAPADVFASADVPQMDPLRRARLVEAPRFFAHNRLVAITPAKGRKVLRLQDLAVPGVKIVVAGPAVPVGLYTAQSLAKMARSGRFGARFQQRVQANVVSDETNVREVLAKVELGEADAGFVYTTDAATARGRVRLIAIPRAFNVIAAYPIAVVSDSRLKAQAAAFVALVLGPQGRAILRKHGFQ